MSGPESEGKKQRSAMIWVLPLMAGILLLFGLRIAVGFYHQYKTSEGAPKLSDAERVVESLPGVKARRIGRILEGETWIKMAPRVRVTLFLLVLVGVLAWAAAILVYEYFLHFFGGRSRRNRFAPYAWLRWIVLTSASVGVLCILYGYFIEPNWLEVTHVDVHTSKLGRGSHLRIVLISDLHMSRNVRLEPRVIKEMTSAQPDVIVFAGDAMNSSTVLDRFRQFLVDASRIAPIFTVKGNQDEGPFWDPKDIYRGTNARELTGQAETFDVRGNRIWIRGMAYLQDYMSLPENPPPPDEFSIFVHHAPDQIFEVARDRYDLYLCGHTHGGQVALPFYGALITFSKFDKEYEAGLYRVGPTTMYVSRGVGLAKWPQPEVRFLARPELTVIDVTGE